LRTILLSFMTLAAMFGSSCRASGDGSTLRDEPVRPADPPQEEDAVEPLTADNCLGDQDMNAEDVDISRCPDLPEYPEPATLGDTRTQVRLGAWEIGTTAEGETYKYGSLSEPGTSPRVLSFGGGQTNVTEDNIVCWAKGYYRLRKMLQNPPADYLKLHAAGFQQSFFQFLTDLRNGRTGFQRVTSYQDHLVKWVTVIRTDGVCVQPTLARFEQYAAAELRRRGIE